MIDWDKVFANNFTRRYNTLKRGGYATIEASVVAYSCTRSWIAIQKEWEEVHFPDHVKVDGHYSNCLCDSDYGMNCADWPYADTACMLCTHPELFPLKTGE